MQTVNTNSQLNIELQVFSDGVLSQADSLPTLSIYDADNDASPLTGFSSVSVTDDPPTGVYSFLLTPAVTNVNRTLRVDWSYNINGIPVIQSDYYAVETPYASIEVVKVIRLADALFSLLFTCTKGLTPSWTR